VDDLAVAAACLLADAGIFFHNKDMVAVIGKLFCNGKADDAGADNCDIKNFSPSFKALQPAFTITVFRKRVFVAFSHNSC